VTNEILFVTNHEVLVKIADLLCVSPDDLVTILITTVIATSTGHHIYPRSLPDAIKNRDNIAKNMYARLFGWVVSSLNDRISPEGSSAKNPVVFSIGLLDMFGFENFKKSNSLDQLLVNTANEELHSAFTRNLIQYNQQNYQQEGLNYHQVKFKDNQKVGNFFFEAYITFFKLTILFIGVENFFLSTYYFSERIIFFFYH
jgi:myosin heavy subunit